MASRTRPAFDPSRRSSSDRADDRSVCGFAALATTAKDDEQGSGGDGDEQPAQSGHGDEATTGAPSSSTAPDTERCDAVGGGVDSAHRMHGNAREGVVQRLQTGGAMT